MADRSLLWINHFAAAPDMTGGTRHVELGRELTARGWRVRLLASDLNLQTRRFSRRRGVEDREPVRETVNGVRIDWLWSSPYERNDHRRVLNWLSFARSVLAAPMDDVPDVIIGSTPHLFAAAAGLALSVRFRRPFFLEVRDLWPESLALTGRRRGIGYAGLWALARTLYAAADRIIVLAEGVADYLLARGVPRSKIVFVPNGVDARAFEGPRAPDAIPRERLRLVYAGAHGPANGLDAVIEAARILRADQDIEFLLVGDGPARAELQEKAAALGLERVHFASPVPKSAMPALLAECDAGLMVLRDLPLFSFGVSPNKLFDYWGARLPVVCNVPGEVASLVERAGGGVQASDAGGEALAAAIRALRDMPPADRRRLGERGREFVVRERDRPLIAERLHAALLPYARRDAAARGMTVALEARSRLE